MSAPQELKDILFLNKKTGQRSDKHPEGNVLKHIMIVTMRAIEKHPDDMDIIVAALFHDLGKYASTSLNPKTGQLSALQHEDISAEYVERFSDWIYKVGAYPHIVKDIVSNHMRVKQLGSMTKPKQTEFYGKKNFDKLMKFKDIDKGGWFIQEETVPEKKWKNYANFSRGYTYFPMYWTSPDDDHQSAYDGDDISFSEGKVSKRQRLLDGIIDLVVERLKCKKK